MGIYVYILRCSDGSYYVGRATGSDLGPRIDQHNAGVFGGYTASRRPVTLVWSEYFDRIRRNCRRAELKRWSRAKKEALIRSDWTTVQRLSQRCAGQQRHK